MDGVRPRRRGLAVIRVVALATVLAVVATGCLFAPWDDVHADAIATRIAVNDLLDQADALEAGDPAGAQDLRDQADDLECAVFGCDAPVGSTSLGMDPTLGGGFFSAPWPSDTRLAPDGSLDLSGFPGRAGIPAADFVLGSGEATTFGFGTNSAVYFQATAPIDPATLPPAPELSNHRRSTLVLFSLDDPAEPMVPLLTDADPTASPLKPADLVTLLPYPGHPLEPGARYAAVAFDGLRDLDGNRLAPSPLIDDLDGGPPGGVDPTTWDQLRDDRDDVIAAVEDRTLWHPSELVAFSAFTTQDTTSEMQAVADAVAALPAPDVLSRTPDTDPCPVGGQSHTTGRLALPSWQEGTRPFLTGGGGIEVGPGGVAVQQGVELGADGLGVLLDMAVPCGPAPPGGWPILLWMNGTGGTARATPISQLGPTPPYAVLSIAPYYSGDRLVVAPAPFDTPEFQFFNYANPLAARTNIVQQAADMLYLKRIAQNLTLAPGEAGGAVDHFDADRVVMAGHSQGSTSLPLTLAVDPTVDGAFLSAGGAGLYHSVLHRGDVRVLVDGLLGAPPGELDVFHPYPQILQTFAEIGDAANYADAITTDVALYAGLRDGCSAIEVSIHLAQAMGIPVVGSTNRTPFFASDPVAATPGYTSPLEPAAVSAPVSANLTGGRTGAMVIVDAGHFGASNYPAIGRSFIDSIAAGGPATLDPGATPPVAPGASCPRFDPVPSEP